MLPLKLLFNPVSLIRQRPDRDWRDVTLWLKWGLLITLASIMVRISYIGSPADYSHVFELLNYLEAENDALTMGFPLKFSLFFLVEIFLVTLVWLIRSVFLLIGYQLVDGQLLENSVALSITGGSMVTTVWILIPGGWYLSMIHNTFLIGYLTSQVNRLNFFSAVGICLLPGITPLIL